MTMENDTHHVFDHQGSPMRWNATIKTDDKDISPYIDKVVIEYDLVDKPSPKGPSSAVWHGTSTPTLEWNFTDPDRGDHQSEFLVEIYNNSDMDSLVYNSTWSNSSTPSHKIGEPLPDGIYFWRARTKDAYHAAGNWSVLKKLKIDTTKPVGSIIIEEDVLSVNEQLIDLAIVATDHASGVADMQIINDRGIAGPWEEYGTAKRIVLESTDGLKTIGVRFRDNAGIVSKVYNDSVYFDLKGPFDVAISSPSHPDQEIYYNNTSPVFEWEPPHEITAIKGYSYMIDTSKHTEPGKVLYNPRSDQASTSPGEFSGLNDGIWYFHITPCDEYDQWGNTTHFQFNIDTREPVLYDLGPDNKEWTNESSIGVSVIMEDIEGYGLDTDSIQYSHRMHGGSFSPWTGEGLKFDVLKKSLSENPSKVKVRADIPLAEGTGNSVRWRVSDLSGNGPAQSLVWELKMDGTSVTFSEPIPAEGEYTTETKVTCGVTISDGDGSGVDGTTVQYSVSTSGPELANFRTWKSVKTNTVRERISVIHEIAFDAGTENYIMWRAKDGVGNGYAYSEAYQVWVNSAPIPVINKPTNSAVFSPEGTITLSASGTTDSEGDELNYYWEVKNRTTKRVVKQAFGAESNITLSETGMFIVYLHVNDGHGFNESINVDIHVVSSGDGHGGGDDDDDPVGGGRAGLIVENWYYLLIGFGAIVLILIVVMIVVARGKRKKEEAEGPNAIQRPIQRPMHRPPSGSYRSERPYPTGVHDFRYPSSYSEGAVSHPYSPYNPPGQAMQPPQSPGSGGHQVQPQSAGYGYPPQSQAGQFPVQPGPGQSSTAQAPHFGNTSDPISQSPASAEGQTAVLDLEPLPGLTSATPSAEPLYSLPTITTEQGIQNLNLMALPPAPVVDGGPEAPVSMAEQPSFPSPELGVESPVSSPVTVGQQPSVYPQPLAQTEPGSNQVQQSASTPQVVASQGSPSIPGSPGPIPPSEATAPHQSIPSSEIPGPVMPPQEMSSSALDQPGEKDTMMEIFGSGSPAEAPALPDPAPRPPSASEPQPSGMTSPPPPAAPAPPAP